MTKAAEQLLVQMLALDADDRLELVDRLSDTIQASTDPEYVAAWEREIKARVEQYERGEIKGIPWREVIENLGKKRVNEK